MTDENQRTIETKPVYLRGWTKVLAAAILILLLLLTLLPIGLQYLASNFLKEQGFQQAEFGDIDLNLFSGAVIVTDVKISGDGHDRGTLAHLSLNLSMLALFSKHIAIESIQLSGVVLDLKGLATGEWSIAGFIPTSATETVQAGAQQDDAETWGFAVDQLQLADISVHLAMPKLQGTVVLDELQMNQLASWLPQQASHYQLRLRIDETPLSLTGQMQPFNHTPQIQGVLELTRLPLAMAAEFVKDAGLEQISGSLSMQSEFNVVLAGQPNIESSTSVSLADLSVQYAQYKIDARQLSWQGLINYIAPESEEDFGLRLNGDVAVNQFSTHDSQAQLTLALFDRLNVNGIALSAAQQLKISGIAFQDMNLLRQDESDELLKLEDIHVSDVDFDGKQFIAINDISLDGLQANVTIEPDGGLKLIRQLQSEATVGKEARTDAVMEKSAQANPWHVKLARFHLADDSRIIFDDKSVEPVFHAEISPLSLDITNIDTADPTRELAFNMNGSVNKHEEIVVSAAIRPFGENLNMTAEGNITALELPPLSPYVDREMGYYIKRGQLNSSLKMEVKENQLSAKISARLNKFSIEKGDPAKAKNFSENLSMPLDKALDLLRDKDDNIKLDVVVDGNINDPQFDVSTVINKALANATKMAVTSYLKFMLQPWGAMLMVAEMVGEAGSAVSLQPISFVAGQVQLNAEHDDYFGKITMLLQDRPDITLNICGVASEQDRSALLAAQTPAQEAVSTATVVPAAEQAQQTQLMEISNDQLLGLAIERAIRVKKKLVAMGVDPGRLFTCQPDIEGAASNSPQVKLSL